MRHSRPSPPLAGRLARLALLAAALQSQAATYVWDVASPGANNWNVNANWLPGDGNPGAGDTAVFGATGTSGDAFTVNNVVSVTTSVLVLGFTNATAANWHVTQIPAGVTLTVSNLSAGYGIGAPPSPNTSVAFFDGGTLLVTGNLTAGNSPAANPVGQTALDLSGLTNFVFNNSAGSVQLSTVARSLANVKFAADSNSVTAASININTGSSGQTANGTVTLGGGTNIFHANTFNIAAGRQATPVSFPGSSGGLRIRGTGGTDADLCNMTLGNHNTSGSGSTAAGTLALEGHPVDLRFGTLTLGRGDSAPTGNSPGNGTLSFDTGTVFANTIAMAVSAGTSAFALANGTNNVGAGATLFVGSGGISMANKSAASGAANGALNVTGGTVICSNSITKANADAGGTGTITLSGATLTMVAGVIGTAAIPIDTLNSGDSKLNLAVVNGTTNVFVTNLSMTSATNNTINILALPTITGFPVQFPLIRYASGSSDFVLGSLPAGYSGSLVSGAGTVDLLISSGPITVRPLVWDGLPDGNWNLSTANWLYLGSPTTYAQGDFLTMDDTANGTTTVNLTTSLAQGSLTVSNATKNYTLNGSGALVGSGLVKDGAAQLTLANTGANTFSNGVTILGGTVLLSGSADRLPTNTTVTLADVTGAALNLNGLNQTVASLQGGGSTGGDVAMGAGNLTVWGGGGYAGQLSGSGQLIKTNFTTGGTLTLSNANTYSGGTIIGGFTNNTTLAVANTSGSGTGSGFVRVLTNGTFSIGTAGPGGSTAAIVITNDGTVRVSRSDDIVFTNVIVGAGVLQVQDSATVVINGTNGHTGGTVVNRAKLLISNPGAVGSGLVFADNSNPGVLQLSDNITLPNPLQLGGKPNASGQVPNIENVSGTNTLTGPIFMTANGAIGWGVYATAGRLLVTGNTQPVLPSQTSQNTSRILQLRGDAVGEWSGNINDTVNSVTNVAVFKAGLGTWTFSGSNAYSGKTTVSEGTLVINGTLSPANAIVEVSGGTLAGTGVINRAVNVLASGTVSPGTSIGTLTVNSNLALFGTTIMEVSHTAYDKIKGINEITMGGTLQVEVVGALTGGEQFKLFEASIYSGSFSYTLPSLPSPLAWDDSTFAADGTLRVTGGAPPQPTIEPVATSGTNLVVTVPTIPSATYVLQTVTNLTPPVVWQNQSTNAGTGGNVQFNLPIEPSQRQKFVRVWVY